MAPRSRSQCADEDMECPMMEILCSETNRMDKNCPAALNLGAARTCVRGKRMAVRPRKVWWEYGGNRLRLSLSRALLGLRRIADPLSASINFSCLQSAQKRPSAAKWENCALGPWPTSECADQL